MSQALTLPRSAARVAFWWTAAVLIEGAIRLCAGCRRAKRHISIVVACVLAFLLGQYAGHLLLGLLG